MQWPWVFIVILIIVFLVFSYINPKTNEKKDKTWIIQVLTRQAARWAVAADQDESPLIAVLHGNYAAGYLWALKDIADSQEVKAATNTDLKTLEYKIILIQDKVTKRMALLCPKYAGDANKFLAAVAGEG